jgi:hypothetical protein
LTIGFLLEMALSRYGVRAGQYQDATIFRNVSAKWIMQRMREVGGGEDSFEETLYDGATGVLLCEDAFIGIGLLQTLKHFVADKLVARARGARNATTMQPVHGASKDGGGAQRNGGMEFDVLRGHGAAYVTAERLAASGVYSAPVCKRCRMMAEVREPTLGALTAAAMAASDGGPRDNPQYICRQCNTGAHVVILPTSYVWARLLAAEAAILGVAIKHTMKTESEVAAEQLQRREMVAAAAGDYCAAPVAAVGVESESEEDATPRRRGRRRRGASEDDAASVRSEASDASGGIMSDADVDGGSLHSDAGRDDDVASVGSVASDVTVEDDA